MATSQSPKEQFRTACMTSDITLLQELFDKHVIDATQIKRCLLENGVDPHSFVLSADEGLDDLKLLHEFGYDMKSRAHVLLEDFSDDREALDWLLDQGVDINLTNTGKTDDGSVLPRGELDWSLHVLGRVAAAADVELFDHLVARGADPHKSLALHAVSRCEDPTRAVAMLTHLLDHYGMDINADNEKFRDFFHQAYDSGTPLSTAIYNKNLAVVKELLRRGADPNNRGETGTEPMAFAVGHVYFTQGYLPALRPLLEAGVDPDTALNYAVYFTKPEAVKICLEFGADPEKGLKRAYKEERKHWEEYKSNMKSTYPEDIKEIQEHQYGSNRAKYFEVIAILEEKAIGDA